MTQWESEDLHASYSCPIYSSLALLLGSPQRAGCRKHTACSTPSWASLCPFIQFYLCYVANLFSIKHAWLSSGHITYTYIHITVESWYMHSKLQEQFLGLTHCVMTILMAPPSSSLCKHVCALQKSSSIHTSVCCWVILPSSSFSASDLGLKPSLLSHSSR